MQGEYSKGSASGLGWRRILLALAFAGAMVLGPAQAATLTVINTDDSGAGSLRQTIADAAGGDTITFDSTLAGSTITLTSGELVLDTELSIEGDLNSDGLPDVTVSGNDSSRVFSVGVSAVASLEGLLITAGNAGSGGAIFNDSGTVTLTNSTVSNNRADDGGGIYNDSGGFFSGTLTLTNSTVSGNVAGNEGGGILNSGSGSTVTLINSTVSNNRASGFGGISNSGGTVTLTNSTVSNNRADEGGGILNSGGGSTMTLTNSIVSSNFAGFSGGGILNSGGAAVTMTDSTISGNVAESVGGGILNNDGAVTLTNSTVSNNIARPSVRGDAVGGGIYNFQGTVTLTNSTVSSNIVDSSAGGINLSGGGIFNIGTVTLTNSTVSGNFAGFSGGGINLSGGTLTLTNSTVSGNVAGNEGGGIFNYGESGRLRIVNTIIANSITNGVEGGDCENSGTLDTANSANNLIETGCDAVATLTDDPELGPLKDNGGPTETHALMLGSLAIDFIPVADCEVSEDQRGVARPQGSHCDIGSYEREVAPIPPPAPVPAAGKWALGMLAMLLLSAMVSLDRRRRRHLKG